jgi:hypothetical protein
MCLLVIYEENEGVVNMTPEKVAQTIAKTKNTIGSEFESPKHLHQTTLET